MMLTVGAPFPVFACPACVGLDANGLTEITNASFKGQWVLYFFYPKDFTFVCPTELVEFNRRAKDFADRNCAIVTGSTDNEYSHQAWRQQHPQLRDLSYPMIAAQKLSCDLGILDPQANVCLRASFLVDPEGIIRWAAAYGLSCGRSVNETLRVLDALQTDELCPCNWEKGTPTLKV